jgi:hypothetical protein
MMMFPTSAPASTWHTIELKNGDSFKLELTRPSFQLWLSARCADTTDRYWALRVECVTNWRDMFQPTANGGRAEVPFTRENFESLCVLCPEVFDAARVLAAKLWDANAVPGDHEKNSPAPPDAATPATQPSDSTAN